MALMDVDYDDMFDDYIDGEVLQHAQNNARRFEDIMLDILLNGNDKLVSVESLLVGSVYFKVVLGEVYYRPSQPSMFAEYEADGFEKDPFWTKQQLREVLNDIYFTVDKVYYGGRPTSDSMIWENDRFVCVPRGLRTSVLRTLELAEKQGVSSLQEMAAKTVIFSGQENVASKCMHNCMAWEVAKKGVVWWVAL